MDYLFIFGAKYLFGVSILIAIYYFWKSPIDTKRDLVKFGVFLFPIAYIVAKILNYFFYNPRPFVVENFTPLIQHAVDNGFPSDHVLLVAAIASLFMFFNKRVAGGLWIIAIIVAISRVYVGVHHWIDVIGSCVISVAVAAVIYYFGKWKPKETPSPYL